MCKDVCLHKGIYNSTDHNTEQLETSCLIVKNWVSKFMYIHITISFSATAILSQIIAAGFSCAL